MNKRILPGIIIFLPLFAYILWQGWVFMSPKPREFTNSEKEAIRKVCIQAATLLEDQMKTAPDNNQTVGVAHFLNDDNDTFTKIMNETLLEKSSFKVEENSIIQRFLKDLAFAVKNATSIEEIMQAGRRVGIDYVILGQVLKVEAIEDDATAEAVINIYNINQGQSIFSKTIAVSWQPSMAYKTKRCINNIHPLLKILILIAFVGLLPIVTPFATELTVERNNNLASFILLTSYTFIDFLAGTFIAGTNTFSQSDLIIAALLVTACAGYNFWICEKIADKRR